MDHRDHYAMSLQEIADHLGVTPQRVYQILRGAVRKLRRRAIVLGLEP